MSICLELEVRLQHQLNLLFPFSLAGVRRGCDSDYGRVTELVCTLNGIAFNLVRGAVPILGIVHPALMGVLRILALAEGSLLIFLEVGVLPA